MARPADFGKGLRPGGRSHDRQSGLLYVIAAMAYTMTKTTRHNNYNNRLKLGDEKWGIYRGGDLGLGSP
jgi:hypothetical protein